MWLIYLPILSDQSMYREIGWTWMALTLTNYLHQEVIYPLIFKFGQNVNLTFDLGDLGWHWPWLISFPKGATWTIYDEIWSKMSIWPLIWGDLDLWPLTLTCEGAVHLDKLIYFVWSRYHQYSLKYGQKGRFDLDLGWPWVTLTQY